LPGIYRLKEFLFETVRLPKQADEEVGILKCTRIIVILENEPRANIFDARTQNQADFLKNPLDLIEEKCKKAIPLLAVHFNFSQTKWLQMFQC